MNFTFTLTQPPDGQWGAEKDDGINWTGMVGMLQHGELDIGPKNPTAPLFPICMTSLFLRSSRHGFHGDRRALCRDDLCRADHADLPQPLHQEPRGHAQLHGLRGATALDDVAGRRTRHRVHAALAFHGG